MNKTIREASTRLLGLLPPDVLHYSLDDLRRFGMPEFIIRRIQLDLVDAFTQSIAPPSTEWVDMSRHRSVVIWNHFVETISAYVHLPRNRAADVVDHAVIETIEIITTPRRRMIEVLYGMSQELSLTELRIRSRGITVHRHIPESLIRYMELKEMQSITRTAAIDFVRKVDDRYCATFTPLSWAQSLDPLFQLAGSRVDAELIRDYFIDKDLEQYAARFENVPHRIERSQLIEILSISDLDNLILDDTRESAPTKPEAAKNEPIASNPIENKADVNPSSQLQPSLFETLSIIHAHDKNGYESESSENRPRRVQESQTDSTLNSDFGSETADSLEPQSLLGDIQQISDAEPELESPFNDSLIENAADNVDKKPEIESVIEDDVRFDIHKVEPDVPRVIDTLVNTIVVDEDDIEIDSESSLNERLNTASVIPIWQQFLDDVPEVDDDFTDENAAKVTPISISETQFADDAEVVALSDWLKPDEKDYIETLFDGDDEAYNKAIDDLSMYQSWSQAQTYLKNKLMPAVSVDFHDELFINFVDQLQHYFSRLPLD